MVIPQVDLGCSSDRNALGVHLQDLHHIRLHSLLNPNRLTIRQLAHLLDIGKVKLPLVGPILRRKHVLLPRLPQQPLDQHLPLRQALRPIPLPPQLLINPAPIHQNPRFPPRLILALQRRHHQVPIRTIAYARPNQHLLVVAVTPLRPHAAVVKLVHDIGVDARRQWERIPHEAVLELGQEVRLPAQAVHLPCPQREGRHGDDGKDDEAGTVLLAGAHESGRVVEDAVEVGIVTGLWPVGAGRGGAEGAFAVSVWADSGVVELRSQEVVLDAIGERMPQYPAG